MDNMRVIYSLMVIQNQNKLKTYVNNNIKVELSSKYSCI